MNPLDTTRKAARALAKTTLTNTGSYQLLISGPARDFAQQSPVALIMSQTMTAKEEARDVLTLPNSILVSIYVRCDQGGEETAEDLLDDLVSAAIIALRNAGFFIGQSDAAPEGAPLRIIDGVSYRVERIPLTFEDYQ